MAKLPILKLIGICIFLMSCTKESEQQVAVCLSPQQQGVVEIPAGEYIAGDDRFYPEEGPSERVAVAAFNIDSTEITNRQYAAFVEATGYKTRAERGLIEPEFDNLPAPMRVPGSTVFVMPGKSEHASLTNWWQFMPGANWRHPSGPESSIVQRMEHPVVHIAYEDAVAYASWVGRRLPTELEWEYAARGGLDAKVFEWGNEKPVSSQPKANTWQGVFPYTNQASDGFIGTAPSGCFTANGYGLYDMTGNVWEWTSTPYHPRRGLAQNINGYDPNQPGIAVNTLKGGSHLCAEHFCYRFRPAARHPQDLMLGTSHIGFRTVADSPQ